MSYRYPEDYDSEGAWEGSPSLYRGVVRAIAHDFRKVTRQPYARLLYGGCGRGSNPVGSITVELCGETFHFGPADPGVTSEEKAEGTQGKVTRNAVDWRWIQEECDLTPLFQSAESIVLLREEWGTQQAITFQSFIRAKRHGVARRSDASNCTFIHSQKLHSVDQRIAKSESRPLALFHNVQRLLMWRSSLKTECDRALERWLALEGTCCEELVHRHWSNHKSAVYFARGMTNSRTIPLEYYHQEWVKGPPQPCEWCGGKKPST